MQVLHGSLGGHFWTVVPTLMQRVRPAAAPEALDFFTTVQATYEGTPRSVRLRGAFRDRPDSDALVVIVHGLGGALDAHYVLRAAAVLDAHGFATLRLALRGADRSGEDFYHAGLVDDLDAAFASSELARFRQLFVLGFSLGGHVSMHVALAPSDARVRGVAAICAPLQLSRSADAIDRPGAFFYRQHVLAGLKDIYAAVAARHPVPTPLARVQAARTIREWDTLTVVPRFGFADVEDYYRRMSVGLRLDTLSLPTLLVQSRHDPMVPPSTFEDLLAAAPKQLELCWIERGGHVGFPPSEAVEERAARWFAALR